MWDPRISEPVVKLEPREGEVRETNDPLGGLLIPILMCLTSRIRHQTKRGVWVPGRFFFVQRSSRLLGSVTQHSCYPHLIFANFEKMLAMQRQTLHTACVARLLGLVVTVGHVSLRGINRNSRSRLDVHSYLDANPRHLIIYQQ